MLHLRVSPSSSPARPMSMNDGQDVAVVRRSPRVRLKVNRRNRERPLIYEPTFFTGYCVFPAALPPPSHKQHVVCPRYLYNTRNPTSFPLHFWRMENTVSHFAMLINDVHMVHTPHPSSSFLILTHPTDIFLITSSSPSGRRQ